MCALSAAPRAPCRRSAAACALLGALVLALLACLAECAAPLRALPSLWPSHPLAQAVPRTVARWPAGLDAPRPRRTADANTPAAAAKAAASNAFAARHLRRSGGNYVNSTANGDWTFCWDNMSQLGASVALAQAAAGRGAQAGNCEAVAALLSQARGIFDWQLAHLWDGDVPQCAGRCATAGGGGGGFFAAATSDGALVDRSVKYTDDNAFAGVTLLESARRLRAMAAGECTNSETTAEALALSESFECVASACAEWLTADASYAWDGAGGGGFWWNVSSASGGVRPTADALKPDNSAALASSLFSMLHRGVAGRAADALPQVAANERWAFWANRTNAWMWDVLFDSDTSLLRWYEDPSGGVVPVYFAYTNALAAVAYARAAVTAPTSERRDELLARARALAVAVDKHFWDEAAAGGGAWVESSVVWWAVSTTLSGWVSKSVLELAELSAAPPPLLEHACANQRFVQAYLRNNAPGLGDGGGYLDACFTDGSGAVFAGIYSTLNCAWGQWLATLLPPACD